MTLNNLSGGTVVAATAVACALWGADTAAAAPDVVGDTYGDAATAIQRSGRTAVVAARVGSGAELDECIVTNAWDASFIREGRSANGWEVMVALNCNSQVASAGKSGNSAASPAGREAKAAQEKAAAAERRQLEAVDTPNG